MQKLIAWAVGAALFCGGALRAQDLSGTWQGTLDAGKGMRMVLKVSKASADAAGTPVWQGIFYSIDSVRPWEGLGVSSMSLHGVDFEFGIAPTDSRYAGKVNGDGSQIVGTWTQGKESHALNLERANAKTAWVIPPMSGVMPVDADPGFEVATIRPTDPAIGRDNIAIRGRHFVIENKTVRDLVTFAYGVQAQQVQGGPEWFSSDKYNVDGTPDVEGQPNRRQMQGMVRKLLADRFGLVFHREKKELGVYEITVLKSGATMTKSLSDPNSLPNQSGSRDANGRVDRYTNVTMGDFAFILQFFLNKPVVDLTGLSGKFDFVLKWTPDDANVADPATASPGIFTAMQEELGLKLESTRAPVDVLAIDKVERPSEN
jgi:uncharacterized protein (TIGR03435 family)